MVAGVVYVTPVSRLFAKALAEGDQLSGQREDDAEQLSVRGGNQAGLGVVASAVYSKDPSRYVETLNRKR